jgi:hypothetical protein
MTTFRHERAESPCIDAAANRRIFWLASWNLGASKPVCRPKTPPARTRSSSATGFWVKVRYHWVRATTA